MRCTEPLTYTPAGTQCSCVWPIEVRLSIRVALYTFFPLVSELAKEIAAGVSLNQSQVRIMGANAAVQQLEETTVLVHLVPLQENFDPAHVFSIYKMFWERRVFIRSSLFGAYQVVYVHYPGYMLVLLSFPNKMKNFPYFNYNILFCLRCWFKLIKSLICFINRSSTLSTFNSLKPRYYR